MSITRNAITDTTWSVSNMKGEHFRWATLRRSSAAHRTADLGIGHAAGSQSGVSAMHYAVSRLDLLALQEFLTGVLAEWPEEEQL